MKEHQSESNDLIDVERRARIEHWKIKNDILSGRMVEKAEVERAIEPVLNFYQTNFGA